MAEIFCGVSIKTVARATKAIKDEIKKFTFREDDYIFKYKISKLASEAKRSYKASKYHDENVKEMLFQPVKHTEKIPFDRIEKLILNSDPTSEKESPCLTKRRSKDTVYLSTGPLWNRQNLSMTSRSIRMTLQTYLYLKDRMESYMGSGGKGAKRLMRY
eukprot:TRINITY_DN11056_c0_g1_i5.p1 TRINITY_DN11056_c0_g1~~TRINITY_DN11056_c0_g1_i5.p1  ORF type:complete len:159 (+),score=26.42 TRINITY_DN11056_c0_g1_i5:92-568(+)